MPQPLLEIVHTVTPDPPYPSDVMANGWKFEYDPSRAEHSDTWMLATWEQRPWLLMLWTRAWQQTPCGSLPDDDALIAAILGMPTTMFVAHKLALLRGWERCSDGRLYHKVVSQLVFRMMRSRRRDRERKSLKPQDSTGIPRNPSDSTAGTGTGTGSTTTAQPVGFAAWWSAYPRKEGKQKAIVAWRRLRPDPVLQGVLLAAVEARKRTDQWVRGVIPHPATWLNGRRWEDEIASAGAAEKRRVD